jgi:hypothetical protein
MLSHGEPGKRVAEHCGTSLAMIEKSYESGLGAMKASAKLPF